MIEKDIITTILDHIDTLDSSEKSGFAHRMIFEIINWSSLNYYEAIGLLEGVKFNYHETWNDIIREEEEMDRRKIN